MGIQIYSTKNNQWRESYNPLRGLTLSRVVAMLDAGERGQYADLQWFYYFMERSDPVVFTVLQRRRAALMECDWDVRRVAPQVEGGRWKVVGGERVSNAKGCGGDEVLAGEQAACLREVYDGVENFREAVGFLFTGFCRGFAHLEKHWGRERRIERLEPVEQWFWVRDGMFGAWQYNRDAVSGRMRGEAVNLDNFVILETIPMNRILCLLYLRRVLGNRNWDAYLDVFGIPPVFLIGPPNAGTDKETEYQTIAEQLFSNGRGYLPNGSDIKYVNAGGGRAPYREQLEYLDKQITLVGTGGLLTMLTEAGSGTLAGGAHSDTFQQIARGDAAAVNTTNANMTVIGEEDSWFVYDRGGGGWLYHCFGSEFPVGGVWSVDFGAVPAPTFDWDEISTTNAYPLARIEDLGAYCTVSQLAAASNALAQAMVEFAVTNDPCTFPVLVLPLGGQWTDFELKASTNNFTSLCYYIMSSGTNAYTSDTNVWVYFTDDYAADVRQWRRSAVATSIGSQVVEPAKSEIEFVVVLPSHAGAVDWRQWMSQKNDKLVWSFVRYDGIGLEMNATGTKTHWSPVVPVEWRTARIAP